MTEEEKKEEVKKEEDKKPLGPLRDLPEYEVGSEDVGDWRWVYRYSAIATGVWNTESQFGKLPLSEEELFQKRQEAKLHRKEVLSVNRENWVKKC